MAYYPVNVLLDLIYVQGCLNPKHLLSLGNIFSVSESLKLCVPVRFLPPQSCSTEGTWVVLGDQTQSSLQISHQLGSGGHMTSVES